MRPLVPHEHGAYGQLAFPILAVLMGGHPSLAAGMMTVACAAAFIATEPVIVLLGQRGPRAAREQLAAARATLSGAIRLTVVFGAAALLLMPTGQRWNVATPVVLALVAIPLIVFRVQKSVAGELFIATTLSSGAVAVGAASGLPPIDASLVAAVFAMGFCAATLGVRASIAAQRREPSALLRIGTVCFAVGAPAVVWAAHTSHAIPPRAWLAALPLSLLAVVLAVQLPSARHLRTVGWGITSAALTAAVILAAILRG